MNASHQLEPMSPEEHLRRALELLGLAGDPETACTAEHFVGFLRGLSHGPSPELTPLYTDCTDPVVIRGVPFQSLCAHHLLPFFGHADIAYRPKGRITGLGSVVRRLQHHASGLQIQERLGALVAAALVQELGASTVMVRLSARHMCMEMRGARSPGQVLTLCRKGELDQELAELLGAPGAE